MKFKSLRHLIEKSIKGRKTRYLVSPTPRELVLFLKNQPYGELRLVYYDKKLYAFSAEIYTHVDFMQQELFMSRRDALAHYNESPENSGAISLIADANDYYLYGLKSKNGLSSVHDKFKKDLKKYWMSNG